MKVYDTLYTIDSAGRVRTWRMEREEDRYRTVSGLEDGEKVESGWTTATPKNVGRANATTSEEQAHAEIMAEYTKKLDRKYHRDRSTVGRHKYIAPMLAQTYNGWPGEACWSQPKLDGIRCIATKEGLFTRQGKPILSCPHISYQLRPFFQTIDGLVLDGELYNHELRDNFNKIASLVRKQKPDEAELAEAAKLIEFHVYDSFQLVSDEPEPFWCRHPEHLEGIAPVGPSIKPVPTSRARTQEELDALYGSYIADGYEGQMVRSNEGPYEIGKRSKHLLKRKDFIDGEFPVSRILEGVGNWKGFAKTVEFILPGDKRTANGDRPRAGIKGSQAELAQLLEDVTTGNPPTHTTIRFQEYTPDGIPRFPVAVDFHYGKRAD